MSSSVRRAGEELIARVDVPGLIFLKGEGVHRLHRTMDIDARQIIEGEYLTSPTSGLYTNAVYGDPRLYGIKVGVKF